MVDAPFVLNSLRTEAERGGPAACAKAWHLITASLKDTGLLELLPRNAALTLLFPTQRPTPACLLLWLKHLGEALCHSRLGFHTQRQVRLPTPHPVQGALLS